MSPLTFIQTVIVFIQSYTIMKNGSHATPPYSLQNSSSYDEQIHVDYLIPSVFDRYETMHNPSEENGDINLNTSITGNNLEAVSPGPTQVSHHTHRWTNHSRVPLSQHSPSVTHLAGYPGYIQPSKGRVRISTLTSTFLKKEVRQVNEIERSLELLIIAIIEQNLKKCDLIIVVDRSFIEARILQTLLRLPNFKQIIFVQFLDNFGGSAVWKSSRCQGVLFLLSGPEILKYFGDEYLQYWDYNARVVIAGLTKEEFEIFVQTKKAKKTEQILGIVKGDDGGHYKIYMNQMYWGTRGLEQITNWRRKSFTNKRDLFPDKISNLRNALLNVVTFEFPPNIIYRWNPDGSLLRYGMDVSVVECLSQAFNFSFDFIESGLGELWGERQPNGSWNGMVGLLARGEGDLGIADNYVTALLGRREFQEFSKPFADDQSCVLARTSSPLPHWQSPALPFQVETWIAIFTGLLFSGPVLNVLARASTQIGHEENTFQSLVTSSLLAYGVHFAHPMATLPHRNSTKIFVAFLWIYAIILTTGYSSNLIAFLTVSRQPASIETFKEIHESDLMVMGLGPFFGNSMAQSRNQYLKAIAKRFDARATFMDTTDDMLSGRGVIVLSKMMAKFRRAQLTTQQGNPMVRILKECFSSYSVAVALQSNSPLKRKFDRVIGMMFESGLVGRWLQESFSRYQQFVKEDAQRKRRQGSKDTGQEQLKEDPSAGGVKAFTIDHMQGVFILFTLGCFLSFFTFAAEICLG